MTRTISAERTIRRRGASIVIVAHNNNDERAKRAIFDSYEAAEPLAAARRKCVFSAEAGDFSLIIMWALHNKGLRAAALVVILRSGRVVQFRVVH